MFSQWLLVICGFLMITDPAPAESGSVCIDPGQTPGVINYVQADRQYGWQVTRIQAASFEITHK